MKQTCIGCSHVRSARVAVVLIAALVASPSRVEGQGPSDQNATAVAKQTREWFEKEATANLVPFPAKLPEVARWTIDTRLHRGAVRAAAMSPDAARVAAGGFDGIVRIWNVDSGELERAIMAHRWDVWRLAWSPDGRWLASTGADHRTMVFDAATGRIAKGLGGHSGVLTWSADSRRLAASQGPSGAILVSDGLSDFKRLSDTGSGITAMAWSPDGRLAVATAGSAVTVIDGSAGRNLFSLEETDQRKTVCIAWSPDGKEIASCGFFTPVMVSDGSSGKQLRTLGQRVTRLAWAPDGGRIAAGDGRTVSIHAKNGTDASKPRPIAGDLLLGWRTDPDRVVAVDSDRIEVWKLDGSKPESAFRTRVGSTPPVFVPGRPIVNGLGSPAPAVWDPVRFTRIARLEGHAADVSVARWSPDGKMLATADSAGTVRTWDAKAGTAVDSFTAYKGAIALLEWSPDGKAIAVAGAAGPVNVFSPTGEKVAEFAGHARGVSSLAWGPTPEHLVTGGRDERTVRWDVPEGTEPKVIDQRGIATSIASQRRGQLAIGYAAGGLAIVNPTTGAVVKDVQGRGGSDSVYGVAWLEGKEPRLISGQGSSVAVVDGVTGVRMPRQVVLNPARSLVLPKNVVVTAGNDRSVRCWNLADAKAVWTIVDDGSALAIISANGSVAFDPDTEPDLMAVVEREDGSVWMPLAEFAKSCGWKNAPKSIKLPTKQ